MGDHRLRDCVVPFARLDFEGDRRQSGPRPFSVRLSAWADWEAVGGAVEIGSWLLAGHPPASSIWHDHHDLFVVDRRGRLWHRRTTCGGTMGFWRELDAAGAAPDWTRPFSWAAVSDPAGQAGVFVVSQGRLLARVGDSDGGWSQPWAELHPMVPGALLPEPVPLGPDSLVTAVPAVGPFDGTADLYITGGDGEVYLRRGWVPGDLELWRRLDTAEFDLASESPVERRWAADRGTVPAGGPRGSAIAIRWSCSAVDGRSWTARGSRCGPFAAGGSDDKLRLAVRGPAGQVSIGEHRSGGPVQWRPTTAEDGWRPAIETDLAWAVLEPGSAWLFASGADGTVRVLAAADGIWRAFSSGTAPAGPCSIPARRRLSDAGPDRGLHADLRGRSRLDLVVVNWSRPPLPVARDERRRRVRYGTARSVVRWLW